MASTARDEFLDTAGPLRKLKVHTKIDRGDDDDGRRVHGWVECPTQGPVALDRCTGCAQCRGVLIEPREGAPKVLCALGKLPSAAQPNRDVAGSWASRPALGITPEVRAKELATLMLEYRVDALVVTTPHGQPLGVVSREDILRALVDGDGERQALCVMKPLGETVTEGTPMAEIATRMGRGGEDVFLADEGGRILAMLTCNDVLRWTMQRR